MMISRFGGVAVALLAAPAAFAQAPVAPPAPVVGHWLKQGTAINLRTETELSSKISAVGQQFELRVADDVRAGMSVLSATVVPAGARGVGEVTRVESKGSFGKLETRLLYVMVGDRRIWITGTNNNGGKDAHVPAGSIMRGYVQSDTLLEAQH